ncbi:MAG TPA: G5 domain-containing protein, partial [Candidatus Polarisedimenticolaceae bacterium]|nr:G5 domain-containing protein [Candidatus Polarisedimenticolaceae bacterium]
DDIAGLGTVGQIITVNRAVPVVILADGQEQDVRTQQKTVGALLHERDVAFGPQDTVSVDREALISPHMTIKINRVKIVVVKQTETIKHGVTSIKDPNLESGIVTVKTAGHDGQKSVTYRVNYQNGSEQARELLAQTVIAEPVAEVRVLGTMVKSGPTADDWYKLRMCESGNNYANKHNDSFRGAYQFGYATWKAVGGTGDPADASSAEQDMRAGILFSRRGSAPWPVCGRFLN